MSGECPWAPPGQAELLARVQATDVNGLEGAVRGLRRTATEYDRVAGEMNGVRAAACTYWQAGSQRAFDGYATVLTGNLTDAAAAMRAMADALATHARATEDAQRSVLAASGLENAGRYDPNQTNNYNQEQRLALQATDEFHVSEQTVRAKLWKIGADAPGGIPLPTRPPEPKLKGWLSLLSQSSYGPQFWINGKDMPLLGNPRTYDPKHPLYGFDEDGNKVPAYEADPMALKENQDGLPVAPILRAFGVKSAELSSEDDAAAAVTKVVEASDGYNDSHLNEHVRQFFNLPGVGEKSPPPPPNWAKDEFLRLIGEGSVRTNRVFRFSLRSDVSNVRTPTYAFLYVDRATQRPLLVQFLASGTKRGQFATAFRPSAWQLKKALEAETIVS